MSKTTATGRAGTADPRRFLDPTVVGGLERLDLTARLVAEGFLTGLHKSPYHGFSVEFAEHRQYMPGDPIRHVDWKLFAKSDRYYIKQYEEETNLRAYLLIDTSGSMLFQSEPAPGAAAHPSKLRYSISLAAALSYLLVQQQDAVGLLTFSDHVHRLVPARSSATHLRLVYREMELEARRALTGKGITEKTFDDVRPDVRSGSGAAPAASAETAGPRTTKIGANLDFLADRIPRRGLVMIMSDLWDRDEAAVLRALKHFRHRQHEVVLFHVQDPAEAEFPYREEGIFIDVETGERLNVLPWEAAKEYQRMLDARVQNYKRACAEQNITYERVLTRTPYDVALLRFLEKRQRMH